MKNTSKGLIIYIVGKFPIDNEPKQGKYPAIFNGMLKRGWAVIMIAQHSKDRNPKFSDSVQYFQNHQGIVIENYLFERWRIRIRRFIRIKQIEIFLKYFLTKIVVKSTCEKTFSILDTMKYDKAIVHVYGTTENLGPKIAERISNKFGLPIIFNVHGSDAFSWTEFNKPKYYRSFLRKVSFFAPVSLSLRNQWVKLYNNDILSQTQVIPNPVEPGIFKISKNKNPKFTFIHISKMDKNRNVDVIIEGFLLLKKQFKNCELWLIGGQPQEDWSRLINNHNEMGSVKFLGSVSRESVANFMMKAHVLVQAANIETFGNPIVEALMNGLPVIVSRSGGPESIVNDKSLGLVLNKIDKLEMFRCMNYIIENYNIYFPEKIREYAIKNYSEDIVLDNMEKIYSSLNNK